MYIYVDILIILNWYINYFLLLSTAKVTHTGFNRKRLILSALIGATFSLMILLPTINYFFNVIIKFVISNILVLIAFRLKTLQDNIKMSLYFCVISFLFCGIMLAIKNILNSNIISSNNGVIYANFSIKFLVISTALCYGILCLIRYLMDKNTGSSGDWLLIIEYDKKSITIDGLADTGNALTDTFSGKPVIICSRECLKPLIDIPNLEDIYNSNLNGFRLIPFSTIGKGGVIISFKPDNVLIKNLSTGNNKPVDVLIGVSGQSKKAIFNPKILV